MREVASLLSRGEGAIIGTVLVEVLRGARNHTEYAELRRKLSGAYFLDDSEATWSLASELLLDLRLRGEMIPVADAIIAAHSLQNGHSVYSTDRHFQRINGLQLHDVTDT
jgi:predicted nucleic acid-binding protein